MSSNKNAKLAMYRSTQTCCANHQVIIDSTPALKAALVLLGTKLDAITAQQVKLATVITGFTAEKEQLRKDMVLQANAIAGMLFALAATTEDAALQVQSHFTLNALEKMTSLDVADACRMLHGLAAGRSDELPAYGLSAGMLEAFSHAIDAYRLLIEKPRWAIAKQAGERKRMDQLFSETDALLRDRVDKLVVQFRESHPEFVAVYKSARLIYDPPTVHTRLKGTARTPDGQALGGVTLILRNGDVVVTVLTGDDGTFDKQLKNGIYEVHAEKAGLQSYDLAELKVRRGRVNHLDFVLKP